MRTDGAFYRIDPSAATLAARVETYYRRMQALDSGFMWSDPLWWRDPTRARVVTAPSGHGFAIIGFGSAIDPDVASEICELDCDDPWYLLPLVRSCLPALRPPWGFQVLQRNARACRCFEGLLTRLDLPWWRAPAQDGPCSVWRYRIADLGSLSSERA